MFPDEAEEQMRTIQLLRDQVDELQVKAAEKRKPWYKQSPSLTSLLALLLSISTAIYSGVQGHKQDVQKKQESLRGIVSALLELNNEQQAKLNSPESQNRSAQEREFIGGMLNSKRMILAEAADNLVRAIPGDVSSSEYNLLANDKLANGGSEKAEEYLKKAVAVSEDPLTKMIALRNLGMFYAQRGPFQSMNNSRKEFQEAIDLFPQTPRDDATAYTIGFTWEMWGVAELSNNFPEQGREKMANARKYYNDMAATNPMRMMALQFLENRMRYFETNAGGSPNEPSPQPSPATAATFEQSTIPPGPTVPPAAQSPVPPPVTQASSLPCRPGILPGICGRQDACLTGQAGSLCYERRGARGGSAELAKAAGMDRHRRRRRHPRGRAVCRASRAEGGLA